MQRRTLANAIRVLSMDAVQKANSGHPGMPMGMADIAEVLWNDFLKHNPTNPKWLNRDRFILSNGHGSMLLYSLLHLTGYDLNMSELKNFRQLHSKTPGHPEYGYTPGVETTTGPLGQGLANAVGMAIAERTLAAKFNQPGFSIIDHYTYVFLGDGCLMEGISHEVCSLAGHLKLNKLIAFYDDNGISIDGAVSGWFTEDTPTRFSAYGWHVINDIDGHDANAVKQAIMKAHASEKPTLLCCKTTIGWGSPNFAGSEKAHGAALGEKEIGLVRKQIGWNEEPFIIPQEVYQAFDAREKGRMLETQWQLTFQNYQQKFPELAQELLRRMNKDLPATWIKQVKNTVAQMNEKGETIASRKASQQCLNAYGPILPELIGGSADLADSNCTHWSQTKVIDQLQLSGNTLYFGVREFGMSAIANGIALYGGFIPYVATFLTFCDYARNALRMAAIMQQRVIFIYTHDSIGLGEDGPTHQPIEHISILRNTPNMSVWRPCDTVETAVAWGAAISRKNGPTSLLFSRQNLSFQKRTIQAVENIARGGYILHDSDNPELILIATGSEVALAVKVYQVLSEQGIKSRLVSMPSPNVFLEQDATYRESVLPVSIIKRVAIEAASSNFWYQFVGLQGLVIGVDRYGESAPAADVFKELGFSVESILQKIQNLLNVKTLNNCNMNV